MLLVCSLFALGAEARAQGIRYYNIDITLPGDAALSGICVMRMEGDDGAMSIVNHFGIKAFDAVYHGDKGKVQLLNVMPLIDKWRIRKVIAKDISFLFNPHQKASKRRRLSCGEDGSMTLTNARFKITYRLQPIEEHVAE